MGSAIRIKDHIREVHDHKEPELNSQRQQIADHTSHRHHQAREIYFPKDSRIGHKSIRGRCQATGEVVPHSRTRQIEQRPRNSVRRDAGNTTKDDHVHDDRQGGLDHKPRRTQDGLLILGNNIPLDKQGAQVPVSP